MVSVNLLIVGALAVFFFNLGSTFLLDHTQNLKICAFNIQRLGQTKLSDQTITDRIIKIIEPYDVILIQEYQDVTQQSLDILWSRLNGTGAKFGLQASLPLGRSTYREQYLFFYNLNSVQYLGSYQDLDSQDIYQREPFSIEVKYFSPLSHSAKRVVLMGLHVAPSDVYNELGELPNTIKTVASHFRNANGVIAMGDFNADCSYLSNTRESQLEIFQGGTGFQSLINEDSTVALSSCAYDRAILYGTGITVGNAGVVNFQALLGLTLEEAQDISDHFPIEIELL